jgi:hypothetical protein
MGATPKQVAREPEILEVYKLFEARKMEGLAAEKTIISELKLGIIVHFMLLTISSCISLADTALDTAVLFTVTFPNLDKGTFRTNSATSLGNVFFLLPFSLYY